MTKRSGRGTAGRLLKALLIDLLLIGVGLVAFALVHHVLPSKGIVVVDTRVESEIDPSLEELLGALELSTPAPALTAEPIPVPTVEPIIEPTIDPTIAPTILPTVVPTVVPTAVPTAEPTTEPTAEPGIETTPTPMPCNRMHGESFVRHYEGSGEPGDFTTLFFQNVPPSDKPVMQDNSYTSESISIRISRNDTGKMVFYVADIYVRSIENIRTAFAKGIFGRAQRDYAWNISMQNKAILSVNGDYYSARNDGVVIRNGVTYRDTLYQDVCVLYRDGEMVTYTAAEFDLDAVQQRGAWQAWSFGPSLLDADGNAQKLFDSTVTNHNPRCGIGYYEPGHYCFVVVEGRNDQSRGATLAELSLIFQKLGCKVAYNMDGGNTAVMTYGKRLVSQPSQGGREVSDIIMISEVAAE